MHGRNACIRGVNSKAEEKEEWMHDLLNLMNNKHAAMLIKRAYICEPGASLIERAH